jgi:hypothetical protein
MFENMISVGQTAARTGLSDRRIQQLAPALLNAGLAKRIGKTLIVHISAVDWIKSLPETRGRKKK